MKNILVIGTGGTIASEMASDGLAPELSANQLLQYVPQVDSFCRPVCKQIFSIDSTNMAPSRWLQIAACIREHYDEFDGFVITHGTDTMAYTAAALSYLIQRSPKPIILTGAQKPIESDNTDSKINLEDAFRCACSSLRGVMVVFNGKVILGTRARKTHSKSFRAFSSINYPELAYIQDGHVLPFIQPECQDRPVFYDKLGEKVALLKLIPGTDSALLEWLLAHNDALIIESFGVGGMPSYVGSEFYDLLARGIAGGKIVVMTTQVENEGSNLSVYSVGSRLKRELGVLEAYDMTTEAVVAKLMWILGRTKDPKQIRCLFYSPVADDLLYPVTEF
ncbi:MAG: asparaginase [Oscillospiraceae bacterium]|nr:asparaginase [Oscillospiraceae bacterium]MBR4655436.1 asparaginase [Oscillospiraceae bacterium]